MAKKKRRKKKYRVFWFFIKLQVFLMLLMIGGVIFFYVSGYGTQVSELQREAKEMVEFSTEGTFRAAQTSLVYAANGELISTLFGEKDVYYLDYNEIPAYAKAAIVSIEDKKFFDHVGIDPLAILRAFLSFVRTGEVTQGGSTITQQLARTVFLTNEKTWERKTHEIFLAVDLERKYSKDKILEFYLNNVYFANGHYGIEAASRGYFSREANQLSLSQLAFLCAIPNHPTIYDPLENIENTIARRNLILRQMYLDGRIPEDVYWDAMNEEIELERPERRKNNYVETYTYHCAVRALMEIQGFRFQTDFATKQQQADYLDRYNELYSKTQESLFQKGYRIHTSIDLGMQAQLQQAVDDALSPFHSMNEEGVYELQGAAVCFDNRSGYVKAIVGGRSQDLEGYTLNRAYQSFRQPGSTIKPLIVFTPELERGYTPDSIVIDEWMPDGPKNADDVYSGPITLRRAVEKSKNTVAWSLYSELTPEVGISYLKKMNFARLEKEDEGNLAASLGGFSTGASPLELTAAYAALEHDGRFRPPTNILMITDSKGTVIYQSDQATGTDQVYQKNATRMMTNIMEGVLVDGTGRRLDLGQMPSAGKTGTTNDNFDGWFVGYTRYYTTGVWVGYDMPRELPGLTGASYPGRIWQRFMKTVHEDLPPLGFLPYVSAFETMGTEPASNDVTSL